MSGLRPPREEAGLTGAEFHPDGLARTHELTPSPVHGNALSSLPRKVPPASPSHKTRGDTRERQPPGPSSRNLPRGPASCSRRPTSPALTPGRTPSDKGGPREPRGPRRDREPVRSGDGSHVRKDARPLPPGCSVQRPGRLPVTGVSEAEPGDPVLRATLLPGVMPASPCPSWAALSSPVSRELPASSP